MPTFLTTSKMNPALAARVEAAVSGTARAGKGSNGPRRLVVSFVRVLLVFLAVFAVRSFLAFRHQEVSELDRSKTALATDWRARSLDLTDAQKDLAGHVSPWLLSESSGYQGDRIADELARGGLAKVLAEPAVYVRGAIGAFGSPKTTAEAAALSRKDPLLVCLYEPPKGRDEKTVLEQVRAVYMGGADRRTRNVELLHDALVGLPFLMPPWEAKIGAAKTVPEVTTLRRELEKAPLDAAKRAARATILIYAMDEPGRGDGPVELDGERLHDVRVGIVDLVRNQVLLRLKKTVDPAWISSTARVVYASGLDGCLLALDVRAAIDEKK